MEKSVVKNVVIQSNPCNAMKSLQEKAIFFTNGGGGFIFKPYILKKPDI
jgi:hypothetical protein